MQLDWVSFSLEIVNFLVLIWILQHFLYRPVLQAIARRKSAIEGSLAEASARQADAQALERQYRGRLAEWEREKSGLREAERAQFDAERAQRLAALRQALDDEREKRRVIEERHLRERARELADEAAAQAARFASRLLERIAAPEIEARLVDAALEDLGALPRERMNEIAAACRSGERVRVTSAFVLSEAQRAAVLERLRAATQSSIEGDFEEDRGLLAGIRLRIGAWLLQANLRDELKFFAEGVRDGG